MPQDTRFEIRAAGQCRLGVVARLHAGGLLLLYLVAGMASASAQTGTAVPTAQTIITRMAQARVESRARLRPYVVTRNYQLFGNDASKAKSVVVADVAFVPPNSKKYTIAESSGSGMGQILVRRMLAGEAEAERNHLATDLTVDNYDFRYIREAETSGQRCYVLKLLPRRKEQHLLQGDIWVDADTYLPHRFEGELAKSPSWWVRDVRLTFDYGEIGGMWLQTSTEAAANVRILGQSTMVSRDVKYKLADLVASAASVETDFLELIPRRTYRPIVISGTAK